MKKFLLGACLLFSASLYAWEKEVIVSTPNTSLLLSAPEQGELKIMYYGEKITPDQVQQIYDAGISYNKPAYPVFGIECRDEAALQVKHADGNLSLEMVVTDVRTTPSSDANLTQITLKDKIYPFEIKVMYKAYTQSDVIETWTEISHEEKKPVMLQQFASAYLPIRRGDVWISHMHGTWAGEAKLTTEPLTTGMKVIKNKDGVRNSQTDHAEVMISLDGKPSESQGAVIGAALCWSGNYRLRFDTIEDNYHYFFAGINEDASEYALAPKEVFVTPELALTYSNEGLGGASRSFHRWARNGKIHNATQPRDILLNSWEGVYFYINEERMIQMMKDIASLGGELFVMDDGWFGGKYQRLRDTSSLGDWVVDTRKLPNGISTLIDAAHKEGIKFGIWVEPEMTNQVSELYEKHPDWIICQSNREARPGRGGTQLVLDVSNPEVQDFMFNLIDGLMTQHPEIAYIKWDANMGIANYGSSYLPKDKQSHLNIEYHRGLRNVLERIRAKYPNLVMQNCASGGGRANYGLMPYFEEFWTSDNTEALQRIYMQWATSYFFPAVAMGAHVASSPNHQTGRTMPMKFRFDVAMTGRLGIEMQPKNMTEKERAFARKAIATYKDIRPVVQQGDLYRLISPYDDKGVASLLYATPSKDRAVFFAFKTMHNTNQILPRFKMAGLDAEKKYQVKELNPLNDKPITLDGKTFTGAMLMSEGIELPLATEYSSRVLELVEVQ